ncbi:MAG: hypothetical protein M3347_13335, partial [Armatimonadota bacterium]|nr:hypothetical protein [Armatimonadota bacterium]
IGFDTDPLSVLLSNAWCMDVNEGQVRKAAQKVLDSAKQSVKRLKDTNAYPCLPDDTETRQFVDYWFDCMNRRQLTALSRAINKHSHKAVQRILWCAFSKMIITKQASVSLAMDLSHSRPHRVREVSDIHPFDRYFSSVESVLDAAPFKSTRSVGSAVIKCADARKLPLPSESIDLVVTSPPYLNAIDYLRGHKFTLVWMGYSIQSLRARRSTIIGTEAGLYLSNDRKVPEIIDQMTGSQKLPRYQEGMLRQYVVDMSNVLAEITPVLIPGGKATLVVGNSTIRGVFVENSKAITLLGMEHGLKLISADSRVLPNNRRYLPPPSSGICALDNRMRTEVVVALRKG